jgi:hypothetical protein
MKRTEFLDPATMTLLMGLAVGLSIVAHEGFSLLPLGSQVLLWDKVFFTR